MVSREVGKGMRESETIQAGMDEHDGEVKHIAKLLRAMTLSEMVDLLWRVQPGTFHDVSREVLAITSRRTAMSLHQFVMIGVIASVSEDEWLAIHKYGTELGMMVAGGLIEKRTDRGVDEYRMTERGRAVWAQEKEAMRRSIQKKRDGER